MNLVALRLKILPDLRTTCPSTSLVLAFDEETQGHCLQAPLAIAQLNRAGRIWLNFFRPAAVNFALLLAGLEEGEG